MKLRIIKEFRFLLILKVPSTVALTAIMNHDSANNKAPVKLTTQYRSINFNKEDLVANSQNPKDLINSFGIGGPPLTPWYPSRKIPPGFHILTGLATRCLQIEKAFVQSLSEKKGQNFSNADFLLECSNEAVTLKNEVMKQKQQMTESRELLLTVDISKRKILEKQISLEDMRYKNLMKKLTRNQKRVDRITKLTIGSSIYGNWVIESISHGITMSKYHTNALEGKSAHLYKTNMKLLHCVWEQYSSKKLNILWGKIISSFEVIWDTMSSYREFNPSRERRRAFYGFRQLLHNFTGVQYPVSHGAFKVHLLEHCYEFMEFYKCSLRCMDETNQESFHKRANILHNRSTKYAKNRIKQEKKFLDLLDAEGHPAFYQ